MTTTFTPRWRTTAAAIAIALVASVVSFGSLGTSAEAAVDHVSSASTDTTYLSDTLGLPSNTVVEPVTYDRFQWLLQQPGQFAFIIGSTNDAGFKEKVQQTDVAAKAAGASKVYWFDPNLTGYTDQRNLDIRNPSGINLGTAAQDVYSRIWRNVLGQYLGNGIKVNPSTSSVTITARDNATNIAANDAVVNDVVDPIWDARTGYSSAISTTDDVFFIYDKDNTSGGVADKIVSWVNLSTHSDAPLALTASFAAAGGGAVIDQLSQFEWWKSSANRKHYQQHVSPTTARYGGDILEDADNAAGWRVQQITYPELLHLLDKNEAGANFVLLFGGTWCHNTRGVIKQLNAEAQENGVTTVYNFDWVLDGGTVNGTNGSGNQIHVRDNRQTGSGGSTVYNGRPSYVYGDVISKYFPNVVTQYVPTNNGVSYFPGGNFSAPLASSPFQTVRKGQVPFLLHYERGTGENPSDTAVQRQWIRQNANLSYTEYMTDWWFTNPSPQIGLDWPIPADESTLTTMRRNDLANARANVEFGQEAIAKLSEFFGALPIHYITDPSVSAPAVTYGEAGAVTLTVPTTHGFAPTGNATLTINGSTYTSAFSDNTAVFAAPGLPAGSHAYTVAYGGNTNLQGFSRTGSLTVNQANVTGVSGSVADIPTTSTGGSYDVTVTTPSGLDTATGDVTLTLTKGAASQELVATLSAGAATVAVPALAAGVWEVAIAYSGDANYVATTGAGAAITVARPAADSGVDGLAITYGDTATITLTVPTTDGNTPSGNAELSINGATLTAVVSGNTTNFTVPDLTPGTYPYTVSYTGDPNILDFELSDSLVVHKASVAGVAGATVSVPTPTATGSYDVSITAPSGLATVTGDVTVTLTKGAASQQLVATLSAGTTTVALPALAAGAWDVAIAYSGDANYLATTGAGAAITVARSAAVSSVVGPAITYGESGSITLNVADTDGNAPSGSATLSVNGQTYASTVNGNTTVFAVPGLVTGSHAYTVAYSGDPNILDFELSDSLVVNKASVTGVAGSVVTAPTTTVGGSYHVTVATPSGLEKASGNVTVTLTKGGFSYQVVSALTGGATTVAVPSLGAGTWTVAIAYAGDSHYSSSIGTGTAVSVPLPPVKSTKASTSNAASPTTSEVDSVLGEEDLEPSPSPSPSEVAPSPEPAPSPTTEPEPTGDTPEEVQAAPLSDSGEGLSTGILVLGALVGVSLLGYVGLQLFQRWSARP